MAAVRLEDLIKAQQKLAATGNESAKKSLQKLEEIAAVAKRDQLMQAAQTYEQVKMKQDEDKVADSLTEKTGDGLNANVVKLTETIKQQFKQAEKGVRGTGGTSVPMAAPQTDITGRVLEERSKEQAARYVPGTADWAKEKFGFEAPGKGAGAKGWAEALKNSFKSMFSLEGILDMSEGKNMGGLLGGQLRRKVEENRYVEDRMATEKGRMLNLPAFQGEEGRKKAEDTFRRQYKEQTVIRGDVKQNEQRIADLRARGFSDDDIKRAGLFANRETNDKLLQKSDAQYRAVRKEDVAGSPDKAVPISPLQKATAAADKAFTDESEEESNRMVGDQTATLKAIEANTRPIKDLLKAGGATPAAEESSGGSLLDMLPGRRTLGRLGGVLKRAGGGLVRSIGRGVASIATRVAPALSSVGSAITSVGGNVASRAAPLLSKAGGFLAEGGGKMLGAAGGIAMGAYDAYKGWSQADEMQKAGLITADEADIKKTSAVTGGAGGAAGAIGGAAAGAAIGSVVPVVGTAIGGLVGGALGYFGGSKVGETVGEYGAKGYKALFGDRVSPVRATPAAIPAGSAATAIAPAPLGADLVYTQSGENAAAAQKTAQAASAPVVINAPTNVNNSTNVGPKSPPRNTESSWQQYNRSKYAMST